MRPRDRYSSFEELTRHEREGADYQRHIFDRASRVVIVAPHGGGIERGITEISLALAGEEFSLYNFEALRQEDCEVMHLTSHRFDDPACLALLQTAQVALGVHGCEGKRPAVLVGGRHDRIKAKLIAGLSLAGFNAHEDPTHPGLHRHNICNRVPGGAGLQIEITEGLREQMFSGLSRKQRQITTPVFDHFIHSLQTILRNMEDNHA